MRGLRASAKRRWLLPLVVSVTFALLASSAQADLRVAGNHLVDGPGAGHALRLLGVNRSGTEYACVQGWGIFDGPSSAQSIRAMKRWRINAVRLPLNEDCWLGINGVSGGLGAGAYQQAIAAYVARLNAAGLYVVIDLHVAAPGALKATDIVPLPDADHAPAFWRSVGSFFAGNPRVLFDLYNEPHDIGWACWLNGCPIAAGQGGAPVAYEAAGMQQLVDGVRAGGAGQPLMLGGVDWSRDLSQWLDFMPNDPRGQLVASEHNYGYHLSPCGGACKAAIAGVAQSHPAVVGELGETDCRHGYIDSWMRWADRHGISYLGWTWDATVGGSWTCGGGPSLIKRYDGTPTAFGVGFRNHFRALARHHHR